MRKGFVMVAAVVLAALAPSAALATLIPTAQNRFVDVTANAAVTGDSESDSDNVAAAGLGLFDGVVDALTVAIAGPSVVIADGVANQLSSIGTNSAVAQGEASVSMTLLPQSGSSASATGNSFFELLFMVDVLSSYALDGSVVTQTIVAGGADLPSLSNEVILENVDNAVILFEALTNDETFSISGLLSPGNYRLLASAGIDANQLSSLTDVRIVAGISSFDLDLQLTPQGVPEPGTVFLMLGGLAGLALRSRRKIFTKTKVPKLRDTHFVSATHRDRARRSRADRDPRPGRGCRTAGGRSTSAGCTSARCAAMRCAERACACLARPLRLPLSARRAAGAADCPAAEAAACRGSGCCAPSSSAPTPARGARSHTCTARRRGRSGAGPRSRRSAPFRCRRRCR